MVPKGRFVRLLAGLVILAGTLTLTGESKKVFTRHDKAFYLSPEQVQFVRPGIVFKITGAQIASDGTMTATFKVTDPMGLPLDLAGVTTPGPISVRLTAAYIPKGEEQYVNYVTRVQKSSITGNSATQPTLDSGGTFQQTGDGTYTYTFKIKAPAGFDGTATHTFAGQAERDLSQFHLGTQGTDSVFTFRPDGAKVTVVRDVVATTACNQCHNPLSAHGGARQNVQYCVVCHT